VKWRKVLFLGLGVGFPIKIKLTPEKPRKSLVMLARTAVM
jgi:hypothetical protein